MDSFHFESSRTYYALRFNEKTSSPYGLGGLAEAKGFEPLVGCPTPVFKTEILGRKPPPTTPSGGNDEGRKASLVTEGRPEHPRDQANYQARPRSRPSLVTDATKLLSAVAEGSDDIYEVTRRLCRSILSEPLVDKAVQVRRALAEGDDFVVVRAVELAEMVLGVEPFDANQHNSTQNSRKR